VSYLRIIPRDLFNEANLLKCYGQLYLNLDNLGLSDRLEHDMDDEYFQVYQNRDSGALTIDNVTLRVTLPDSEDEARFYRPLNSRKPYPLYLSHWSIEDDIAVFNDDGTFTAEMISFLNPKAE
jgi:hypothetical protein